MKIDLTKIKRDFDGTIYSAYDIYKQGTKQGKFIELPDVFKVERLGIPQQGELVIHVQFLSIWEITEKKLGAIRLIVRYVDEALNKYPLNKRVQK